jgi:hypothetical protein
MGSETSSMPTNVSDEIVAVTTPRSDATFSRVLPFALRLRLVLTEGAP